MKKVKLILVVAVAAIIGAGIFYACQKEPIQELNAHETTLGNKIQKLPDQPLPKYYRFTPCYVNGNRNDPGYRCDLVAVKPTDACATGYSCKGPIIEIEGVENIIGYIGTTIISDIFISDLPKDCYLKITAEILQDKKTQEGIMPCNGWFFIIDKNSEKIKGSWLMGMSLTNTAIEELDNFIKKGDKKKQKEIFSSFKSYNITIDNVLLTRNFSKIIYMDGDKFTLNYKHVEAEIWRYFGRLLN